MERENKKELKNLIAQKEQILFNSFLAKIEQKNLSNIKKKLNKLGAHYINNNKFGEQFIEQNNNFNAEFFEEEFLKYIEESGIGIIAFILLLKL